MRVVGVTSCAICRSSERMHKKLQDSHSRLKCHAESSHEIVDHSKERDSQSNEPHQQGCMSENKHKSKISVSAIGCQIGGKLFG